MRPNVGSKQPQQFQFRGMRRLYPGCVKVRQQPCCCPAACNSGKLMGWGMTRRQKLVQLLLLLHAQHCQFVCQCKIQN
jgi:hypothetical protein